MLRAIFYLLIISLNKTAFGFVQGKTNSGLNLKWNLPNNQLTIFVDSNSNRSNSFNLDQDEIDSIILKSINEWSDKTVLTLNSDFSSSVPDIGSSATIRFTNNSAYFGNGVLAVTSIAHDPSNGDIWSADILINESDNNTTMLTGDPSMSSGSNVAFLGDVVTHELGHLLGLAHSEVIGSSMLYSVFKGQYEISNDDITGINYIYSTGSSKKVFRGKVTSGNGSGIFGANVQIILHSSGQVYTSQVTDTYGYFYIKDLPIDDFFVIYVTPPKSLANYPQYFASAQTQLCNGEIYKSSFFTQCGGRSQSRPQLFSTSFDYEKLYIDINDYYNKSLKFDYNDHLFSLNYFNNKKNENYYYDSYDVYDLGELTIHCREQVAPDYLLHKYKDANIAYEMYTFEPTLFDEFSVAGDTFLGSFNSVEIENGLTGKGDLFHLNYTYFEDPTGKFLDLKISTESLGSMLKLKVIVKNLVTNNTTTYETNTDDITGRHFLNHHIKHPLSSNNLENDFEISIIPEDESAFGEQDQQEILANPSVMKNYENTYLMMFTVGFNTDEGEKTYPVKQYMFPKDNKYCRQGTQSKTVVANITENVEFVRNESDENFSCATIDLDDEGSGGSGPFSFILGLTFILALSYLKDYRLKALSK